MILKNKSKQIHQIKHNNIFLKNDFEKQFKTNPSNQTQQHFLKHDFENQFKSNAFEKPIQIKVPFIMVRIVFGVNGFEALRNIVDRRSGGRRLLSAVLRC